MIVRLGTISTTAIDIIEQPRATITTITLPINSSIHTLALDLDLALDRDRDLHPVHHHTLALEHAHARSHQIRGTRVIITIGATRIATTAAAIPVATDEAIATAAIAITTVMANIIVGTTNLAGMDH
jgi:hypothetical protein